MITMAGSEGMCVGDAAEMRQLGRSIMKGLNAVPRSCILF